MKHYSRKFAFGLGISLSLLTGLALGKSGAQVRATQFFFPDGVTVDNYRMPAAARNPELIYATFSGDAKGTPRIDRVDEKSWVGDADFKSGSSTIAKRFTPGLRFQYLFNSYYANTRSKSNSGLRHVACFLGDPTLFIEHFLGTRIDLGYVDSTAGIVATMSADRYLIGLEGVFTPPNQSPVPFHFRLPSCYAPGKTDLLVDLGDPAARSPSSENPVLIPYTAEERADMKALVETTIVKSSREPASDAKKGFEILDVANDAKANALTKFTLSADYDTAETRWNENADRPWKGMSVETPDGQLKVSQLLLDYAYDGMVNGPGGVESVLYAEKNQKRYWCHMPWLNVGDSGREAIHGFTKERALAPSGMYPDATFGSDWGVGFYNAQGCRGIRNVFGTRGNPKAQAAFQRSGFGGEPAYFPDGTVAVKFLFTTANFVGLQGTHVLQANVTHEKGETKRKIRPVSLVQIDIAVKDSSLRGARKGLESWVMTTYYYDATYVSPSHLPGIPPGFRKMRPQGMQIGLGLPPNDSSVFAGSKPNGLEGRLNGPADNPKGSCLGCHATAGTTTGMVPGFLGDNQYASQKTVSLDFSQQLALAKRNSETQPRNQKGLE